MQILNQITCGDQNVPVRIQIFISKNLSRIWSLLQDLIRRYHGVRNMMFQRILLSRILLRVQVQNPLYLVSIILGRSLLHHNPNDGLVGDQSHLLLFLRQELIQENRHSSSNLSRSLLYQIRSLLRQNLNHGLNLDQRLGLLFLHQEETWEHRH